jgi:aromatic acid exporter family member 1
VNWRSYVSGTQLAIRAALAAALSVAIARLLKLEFPIYAFLGAVIVTDLTPSQSTQLGLRRIVANLVGAVSGAALEPGASARSVGRRAWASSLQCLFLNSCKQGTGPRLPAISAA